MRYRSVTLTIITALLLGGCIPRQPSRPVTRYTLPLPSLKERLPAPLFAKTLKIARPESSRAFKSTKIYYTQGMERNPYAFSRWSDTPVRMFERYLIEYLREKRLFKAVIPHNSRAANDLLLESQLLDFSQHFEEGKSKGVVSLHFDLIEPKSRRILASKTFSASFPATSQDSRGGTEALAGATKKICEKLYKWLISISKNY
ncbi:MAG: hypothetical protein B6D59_08085 [Campylobacteraceae bacterium 4484_4]|nr:MAG: hypothetical protein B6D59_08085 [Campylobacteraceae bacterium 4484_4]